MSAFSFPAVTQPVAGATAPLGTVVAMHPFPARLCSNGHLAEVVSVPAANSAAVEVTARCSCGWTGHTVTTARAIDAPNTPLGVFRGSRSDALRELAHHAGYDRAAHLAELDAAIANLQIAELHGGQASVAAAHRVVDLQQELESAAF
jgi:hypothetical protein